MFSSLHNTTTSKDCPVTIIGAGLLVFLLPELSRRRLFPLSFWRDAAIFEDKFALAILPIRLLPTWELPGLMALPTTVSTALSGGGNKPTRMNYYNLW